MSFALRARLGRRYADAALIEMYHEDSRYLCRAHAPFPVLAPFVLVDPVAARQPALTQSSTSATAPKAFTPQAQVPRGNCPCSSGTPENEPDCGVPIDTVNGGCNYAPIVYSHISPGETVCGTVGTMLVNGTKTRDTDWYQFTINTPATITWSVRAEFDVQVIIAAVNCPLTTTLANITGTACSDVVASADVPAGTYIVFVASNFFSGLPFGSGSNSYRATLTTIRTVIEHQPVDTFTCTGGTVEFEVLTLPGMYTYQWRRNGDPILHDGNMARLRVVNVGSPLFGEYDRAITNECASMVSDIAMLTICDADFDCDGVVDSEDFFRFLTEFFGGTSRADLNHDGFVNSQDFFDFLSMFFAGCA